jgi:hypothetical protein
MTFARTNTITITGIRKSIPAVMLILIKSISFFINEKSFIDEWESQKIEGSTDVGEILCF